ncbi:MAG: sigma-70 family RNA polymerase sigma factor [Planctomycetota bacterium]
MTAQQKHPETAAEDARIVSQVLTGDREIYGRLVEKYQDRLYSILFSILRNHDLALEICQDTFLRAFNALHLYDSTYKFSSWLFRIGVNLSFNKVKRLKLERKTTDRSVEVARLGGGESGIPPALQTEETKKVIWEAMEQLPENYRTALTMRYFEGLSCKDIAEVLGVTPNVVSINIHRGKKLMQRYLKDYAIKG